MIMHISMNVARYRLSHRRLERRRRRHHRQRQRCRPPLSPPPRLPPPHYSPIIIMHSNRMDDDRREQQARGAELPALRSLSPYGSLSKARPWGLLVGEFKASWLDGNCGASRERLDRTAEGPPFNSRAVWS